MKKLAIMAGCGLLMALGAAEESATRTMPTQEELDKAVPLIQELMRDDLAAVRTGKKTREQIGDIAVALAKQAQSPAEKYLLLTSAFEHYMRGGSYDKANSSLADLRTAIPDWKHSDEYTLIEKSLRIIASGKGGPVRERYEELKERQQYASRLKKALEQAKAKPGDKKLQFQVAAYYAALDRWPQALDAFIAGSSPACAAAAKLEKESAAPGQIADAWWSAADIHPEFLSVAIRAHAVDLYKKAIAANSLAGLQKVVAERRIREFQSAAESSGDSSPKSTASSFASSVGTAKYYGVELIGGSVKENKGILSGFANKSYAKVKAPFDPKNRLFEVVIAFKADQAIGTSAGVFCGAMQYGFAPLFVVKGQMTMFLSSNGVSWNIANGTPMGLQIKPKTVYRVKIIWDGKEFALYLGDGSNWCKMKSIPCETPIFGGLPLHFGVGRSLENPFPGTIDLNKCYICIDGKLWWEGVKGAYHNALR